jgi:hypothetical protein
MKNKRLRMSAHPPALAICLNGARSTALRGPVVLPAQPASKSNAAGSKALRTGLRFLDRSTMVCNVSLKDAHIMHPKSALSNGGSAHLPRRLSLSQDAQPSSSSLAPKEERSAGAPGRQSSPARRREWPAQHRPGRSRHSQHGPVRRPGPGPPARAGRPCG